MASELMQMMAGGKGGMGGLGDMLGGAGGMGGLGDMAGMADLLGAGGMPGMDDLAKMLGDEGMAKEMADLASGNPDAMNVQLGELKNALASGQISDAEKKEMRSALSSMLGGANLDDALRELDRTGGAGLGAQEREALSVLRKALG